MACHIGVLLCPLQTKALKVACIWVSRLARGLLGQDWPSDGGKVEITGESNPSAALDEGTSRQTCYPRSLNESPAAKARGFHAI